MSSGPHTIFDALTVADGYLDEAAAFLPDPDITPDEEGDLALAQDYLRKVIASIIVRREATPWPYGPMDTFILDNGIDKEAQ